MFNISISKLTFISYSIIITEYYLIDILVLEILVLGVTLPHFFKQLGLVL